MSRLSERELALLLAKVRETYPTEAARLEAHLEAEAGRMDFLQLFERILTASNELGQVRGSLDDLQRELTRWADAQEAANEAEKTSLGLQRDSLEHEQAMEQAAATHQQALEQAKAEHAAELQQQKQAAWGKLGGALVTGGAGLELLQFLFERLTGG